jgi:hypothetical protein
MIGDHILGKLKQNLIRAPKRQGHVQLMNSFMQKPPANFDRMRRAWRNPTMHPDKTYSQTRAEEILLSVKSFMVHLAGKLYE